MRNIHTQNEGCCCLCNCASAKTSCPDDFSDLCNYVMGLPQVSFLFRVEPPIYFVLCWIIPMIGKYASWCWFIAHAGGELNSWFLQCFGWGLPHATSTCVLQPFNQYGEAYSFRSLVKRHPIPPLSLHGGEGFSFPYLVSPNDTVNSESVLRVKSDNYGVA